VTSQLVNAIATASDQEIASLVRALLGNQNTDVELSAHSESINILQRIMDENQNFLWDWESRSDDDFPEISNEAWDIINDLVGRVSALVHSAKYVLPNKN